MFCKNCGKDISDNAKVCPHCGEAFEGESWGDRVADVALRSIGIGLLALALGYFFTMLMVGIFYLLVGVQGPQPGRIVDIDQARDLGMVKTIFGMFFTVMTSIGIFALVRRPRPKE